MKSIKKGIQIQKCRPSEKYNQAYVLSTWCGPFLHEILPECGMAWMLSACGPAEVLWKTRMHQQRP